MSSAAKRGRGRWGLAGAVGLLGLLGLWLGRKGDDEPTTEAPKRRPKIGSRKPGKPTPDGPEPEPEQPTPDGPEPEPEQPDKPARDPKWIGKNRPKQQPPLVEIVTGYPRGGRFYQVVHGDRFGGEDSHGIAYRYLLSEAYLAATEFGGLNSEEANAWARVVAKRNSARIEVIDLIQCSGWNDVLYGAEPKSGTRVSATGRSILLLPQHAPILELLTDGEQPRRNAKLSNGQGVASADRNYELLWLPAIDRKALWESGGTTITTLGVWWSDGATKENPPTWIIDRGISDPTGATNLISEWGCPGGDGVMVVS